jgi:hypothetical protein
MVLDENIVLFPSDRILLMENIKNLCALVLNPLNPNLALQVVTGFGAFICSLYIYYVRHGRSAPLPPGPFGLPIIGSLLHYPKSYPWFKFTEWKHQFG